MNRLATVFASGVAVLVLIVAVTYVTFDEERIPLDATARAKANAPGKFVQLHDGITHYDLSDADGGRTIVLLSGATVPFYLWDPTRAALVANGWRVLRYDYFGRGFSDRPRLSYDLDTYDRQLTELLDTLDIRGRVDVAGVSMGGVIAASFGDRHAERVRSLTLVDPAFAVMMVTPLPLRIPGVGELLMTVAAPKMAKGQLEDFLHRERYPDWVERYEVQMRYEGFRRGVLATARGDVFKRPAQSFTALARSTLPMLVLWGKEDRTVPFSQSAAVRAAFPGAEFTAVADAGHLPQIEQAAVVEAALLGFLRSH